MHRRLEDRIQKLCGELLGESDEQRIQKLTTKLRFQLRSYIHELRKQFAAYPGVHAYRRKTDPLTNAPAVPSVPASMAPSPVLHNEPEVAIEGSGEKNGRSEVKAS